MVDALRSLRVRSVTIDGEAVRCGKDGKPEYEVLSPKWRQAFSLSDRVFHLAKKFPIGLYPVWMKPA